MFSAKKKTFETNHARGVHAEELAAEYLKKIGFKILASRYKTKFGEIDLIIQKGELLCFVEVKARPNKSEALESVTARARGRIEKSALFFLSENPEKMDCDMRFDVVVITGGEEITHLDNAWEATIY